MRLTDTQAFWLNELDMTPRRAGWGGFSARTAGSLAGRGLATKGSFDDKYHITLAGRTWLAEHETATA